MPNFISAVLGGLVVGTLLVFLAPNGSGPVPAVIMTEADEAAAEQLTDHVARRRLDRLDDRLRALEAHRNPGAKPSVVRTVIEATVPSDLRSRVRTLESDLADLRRRISLPTFQPHRINDRDEARRLIEISISQTGMTKNTQYLGTIARIPLRLRFLEEWPRHKDAPQQLHELVNDYIGIWQPDKARASVDRFGPQTGMPAWALDLLRLQAAHRDVDRVEIAGRILNSPVAPSSRAWAMQVLAMSLARVGQRDDALATIDALVTEFASTDAGRHEVRRARGLRKKLLAGR